jgi:catechol 2,3-dioxygenase-like lactoylglutathione lyase family enzyme
MIRIKLAGIFVTDQDAARAFYTDLLGLQVGTDAAYGPRARWLTVVSPDDPEGTALLLGLAEGPAADFQRATYESGKPAISLTTDDIENDHKRLEAAGVRFSMPPTRMPYGGVDAVLEDGCGNLINLHQDG